jgi:hypothetical protein
LIVRIYADSLALPRAETGIGLGVTYPEVLRGLLRDTHPQQAVLVHTRAASAGTVGVLHQQWLIDNPYFGHPGADLLVIQCGVVDCAPRPLPHWARRALSRFPRGVRGLVVAFLHANRPHLLRAGIRWRRTPPRRFARILGRWLAAMDGARCRVCVVNIAPTDPASEAQSPGFGRSISAYNDLIASTIASLTGGNVALVDVHRRISAEPSGVRTYVAGDGHHLTESGHVLYAQLIMEATRLTVDDR